MAWGRTYNVIQSKKVLLSRKIYISNNFLHVICMAQENSPFTHIEGDDAVERVSILKCQTADEERC